VGHLAFIDRNALVPGSADKWAGMFGPVFLFLLVILVVWLLSAGGRGFVRNAAELLDQPLVMRSRLASFLSGWHQVKGSYEGRPAALTLQERRSRRRELAYLMAAIEAVGPLVSLGDNTGAFQDSIADRDGRRALYDLTVKHEVSLKLDGRWLTATWMPVGFTVMRFDRPRWPGILAAMCIVVRSLEHDLTLAGPPPPSQP
jgi:hypothetical protein